LFEKTPSHTALLVDNRICEPTFNFSYATYTREQNQLMYHYDRVYRFLVDDETDVKNMLAKLCAYEAGIFDEDRVSEKGPNRSYTAIDPTLPEATFEQVFMELFGHDQLENLAREFPILDSNGQTRYVDYYLQRSHGDVAIEKNGETFHHPMLIGKKRYLSQLEKQNSLSAYGIKTYRWSLQTMKFREVFAEELKRFLGTIDGFKASSHLHVSRSFRLLEHQENYLLSMEHARRKGDRAFLVLLPTGTGKTEILIADLAAQIKKGDVKKALVLVPSRTLVNDHLQEINRRLPHYGISSDFRATEEEQSPIVVRTYAWAARNAMKWTPEALDYLVIDEAHHAVAPVLQRVIQHFNPGTLLGLTATDQRLDQQSLSRIFGQYESRLGLKEAIDQGLLAPIRAFRVKSNVDLSQVRFNGKDYVVSDLQKTVILPSRDQLIVDVLKKYFLDSLMPRRQGVVFCVSVAHAERLAQLMRSHGISAKAVSGKDESSQKTIEDYQQGQLQFLTTCSLLNEGWNSPQTAILVMARPTMSKVLYMQQLGRGTRKAPGKESLFVIDVVDNYGALQGKSNRPWSVHALFGMNQYLPWGNVLHPLNASSPEELILSELFEQERKLEVIDIFTFEAAFPDHLSEEQLARTLFVSTSTIHSWLKTGKIAADVSFSMGRRPLHYFDPDQVPLIREALGLKVHDESTQIQDFWEFIGQGDFTLSYKLVMVFAMLFSADVNGECDLTEVADHFSSFYRWRLENHLTVDKASCPFKSQADLEDQKAVKRSILVNPFEKFERKRFMVHCKDLNRIAFSSAIWAHLRQGSNMKQLKETYFQKLEDYYRDLGGLGDREYWKRQWRVEPLAGSESLNHLALVSQEYSIVEVFPSREQLEKNAFVHWLPVAGKLAAGERFSGFALENLELAGEELPWVEVPDHLARRGHFIVQVLGHSMAPTIAFGDYLVCAYHRHVPSGGSVVIMADFSHLSQGEHAVKRIEETANDWLFHSDNPSFPALTLTKTDVQNMPILGIVLFNLSKGQRVR
jgi:superfamily II DNA or RNA helicase/phage repressor protein C with HTH and peptisase S24 domain